MEWHYHGSTVQRYEVGTLLTDLCLPLIRILAVTDSRFLRAS